MKPMPAVPMPLTLGDLRRACRHGKHERARLEEAVCEYHGAARAFGVSSGRAALCLTLKTLHRARPERDVVIVPSYTCPTVGRAVAEAGLRGRCADVSADTLNIEPARVAEVIDDRVLAVVAPHMFGLPCDLASLSAICAEAGTFLVEDCAQCVGGRWAGDRVGTFGDVSFLSMGRTKNVRGYEGGVLWTKREDLVEALGEQFSDLPDTQSGTADRLKQAATTLASNPRVWALARNLPGLKVGAEDQAFDPHPSKLADWQAGLGLISLGRVDEYNERRRELARALREALAEIDWIQAQRVPVEAESTYLRFATRAPGDGPTRDGLVARLQAEGVDARAFYTRPIADYEWWRGSSNNQQMEVAKLVVDTNLILPMYWAATARSLSALSADVVWLSHV